jgi:drug/metabolite transporter (DMT)-like permease
MTAINCLINSFNIYVTGQVNSSEIQSWPTAVLAFLAAIGMVAYVLLNFASKEPPHPRRKLYLVIYALILILMLVAGLYIIWPIEFVWQDISSFYAVYGFSACIFLIYAAKGLRLWLPKDEDYYEKKGDGR